MLLLLLFACADPSGAGPGALPPRPAPSRPQEPPPWQPTQALDEAAFPWPAQAGDPTEESVILSLRTERSEVLAQVMAEDGQGGWVEVARPVLRREEGSLVARARLEGLQPDRVHAWIGLDPDEERRSRVGRFRTAPRPEQRRQVRLVATSCLGGNDPLGSMSAAASLAPDLALLLGDTVYADDAQSLDEYRAFYDTTFRWAGPADWLAGSAVVATWDDHEVTNDYVRAELEEGRYEAALQAFREALPQQEGPSGGVWRRLAFGGTLDLFVLDVRSERDAEAGLYIGEEQERWLIEGLRGSEAAFQLVLTSVPITDYSDFLGELGADDRWQGWPAQRSRVLAAVEELELPGLLWLGGDVHFAAASTVDLPGGGGPGEHQWELLAGPAGRSRNVAADLYEHDGRHYPVLFSTFNSLVLDFDPGLGRVEATWLDDQGTVLALLDLDP